MYRMANNLSPVSTTVVGLITARGGSKSVPRKNVAPIGGKPLIAWTIEAALKSRALSRVIVSTDDDEIATVARRWGAEVPFMRPVELAQDDSSHVSVLLHALCWLEAKEGYRPEYLMILQPTSPFRTAADIDAAIQLAHERDADAVVAVTETAAHPYLTRKLAQSGVLVEFITHDIPYTQRQALPAAYAINGAIFLNRCDSLQTERTIYPEGMLGYVMPQERSVEIDTPWDMHVAGLIMNDLLAQEARRGDDIIRTETRR
jgi:CMP-N-acetylneuraminic acid synthetase